MKKKNGFSMAFTIALMGVVIAISTVIATFVVMRINSDNNFSDIKGIQLETMQFEYDFVNLDYTGFVNHLTHMGASVTTEDESQIDFVLKDKNVTLKKDYTEFWLFLSDKDNTELMYIKVDGSRKVIEKRTKYS